LEKVGILLVALFAMASLVHYATKLSGKSGVTLTFILSVSLTGIFCVYYYFLQDYVAWGISTRAALFLLLYVWCALGMIILTGRSTHQFKIFLGLVSQAGILYALFIYL
jgi:hypothetical protein